MAQTEDIEADLVAWLRTQDTLTVLLDKDKAGVPRIHPQRLPQSAGSAPRAIVYHLVSDVSETAAGGAGSSVAGVVSVSHAVIQFDCYGPDPITAKRIRHKLKARLDAFQRGLMNAANVCAVVHQGDRQDLDEPQDGSDSARFIRMCDYRISYQRATT